MAHCCGESALVGKAKKIKKGYYIYIYINIYIYIYKYIYIYIYKYIINNKVES